jgi:hypothetical protein
MARCIVAGCLRGGSMTGPSGNVRVYLDLRSDRRAAWHDGLSAFVETTIKEALGSGAILEFRRKRAVS